MKYYAVRNNQLVEVWKVTYKKEFHLFDAVLFIKGTESEMRAYVDSEIGYCGSYHAISEEEMNAVKSLGFNIYLAPEL